MGMVCPMRMFPPPAGGPHCVLQKDRFGCCDTGYKCDRVVPPAPQSLGGGVPGGYGREALSAESKKVAAYAMKSALSKQQALHKGCDRLTLLEVLEVHRQIVAGTNFKMKLRLRNRVAPECRIDEVRVSRLSSSDLFLTLANRETDAFKFLNQQQSSVKARHFVLDNSATKCFVWFRE